MGSSSRKNATFDRFGKALHFRIRSAQDLHEVLNLDEAHWVATSAPLEVFSVDPVLLSLVNRNADERILAADLRESIACSSLRNYSG